MRARLGKGAIPRVRDGFAHRQVEFKLPIGCGTVLALVMVKWAMKPVCHACSTDNVAVAA